VAVSSRADPALLGDLVAMVTLERGDIRDAERMRTVIARHRPDVVIHLAALMPAVCRAQPALAVDVNVTATAALYAVAAGCGVQRFVYASSKSAYGPLLPAPYGPPEFCPIPEDLPARPVWAYDVTKRAGEQMIEAQRRAGGPEATSLRFATIYGPGKGDRYGGASVLSGLLEAAIAGGGYAVARGGDQVDDVIWVGDAAAGVVAAALHGAAVHPLYNIATGARRTFSELVAEIAAACPEARLEVGPGLHYMGEEPTYGVLDPSLARTDLGFVADPDMVRGVRLFRAALAELAA
jgi:UDP-glucose 4-epimerase